MGEWRGISYEQLHIHIRRRRDERLRLNVTANAQDDVGDDSEPVIVVDASDEKTTYQNSDGLYYHYLCEFRAIPVLCCCMQQKRYFVFSFTVFKNCFKSRAIVNAKRRMIAPDRDGWLAALLRRPNERMDPPTILHTPLGPHSRDLPAPANHQLKKKKHEQTFSIYTTSHIYVRTCEHQKHSKNIRE